MDGTNCTSFLLLLILLFFFFTRDGLLTSKICRPLSGSTRLLGATPKSLLKSTGLRSDDQGKFLKVEASPFVSPKC